MSKSTPRPDLDLWANVDESALSYPAADTVLGDKRTNYPAGAPLSSDSAQAAEAVEIAEEAKATTEKPKRAKGAS